MSDRALGRSKSRTNAEYEIAAKQLLAQMEVVEQQMDADHAEGLRLKAETQVIKDRIAVRLARLEKEIRSWQRP